jgi:hypothetical protein
VGGYSVLGAFGLLARAAVAREWAAFRLSCPLAWNWPGRDGTRQDGTGGGCDVSTEGGTLLRSSVLPVHPSPICVSDSGHADGDGPRDSIPETWIYGQKRETEARMRWGAGLGAVPRVDVYASGARGMYAQGRDRRAVHVDSVVQIQMR